MREATRRQVFGIGAGAIGVLAAPGSVAAVAESRPNDARLMELEKRFYEAQRATAACGEDDDAHGRCMQREWAIMDEMAAVEPDTVAGHAATARVLEAQRADMAMPLREQATNESDARMIERCLDYLHRQAGGRA